MNNLREEGFWGRLVLDKPIIPDGIKLIQKDKDVVKFTSLKSFLDFKNKQRYFSGSYSHCFYSIKEYNDFTRHNKKSKYAEDSIMLFETGHKLVALWDAKNKVGYIIPSK